MTAEPEISGEAAPQLFSADKNGPGFKSDFTLGGKMTAEPEISGESSPSNFSQLTKMGQGSNPILH
jgi:hypothetical protein